MKKKFLAVLLVLVSCVPVYAAQTPESIISDSLKMIQRASGQSDAQDMAKTLRTSHAIALIPSMLKAGLLVGGSYGEGLILLRKNGKMSKGLFAGVSLDGSVISISVKRNQQYWGRNITAEDALKQPANDKRIKELIRALDELVNMAND